MVAFVTTLTLEARFMALEKLVFGKQRTGNSSKLHPHQANKSNGMDLNGLDSSQMNMNKSENITITSSYITRQNDIVMNKPTVSFNSGSGDMLSRSYVPYNSGSGDMLIRSPVPYNTGSGDMLSRLPVPYDSGSGDMLSRSPVAHNSGSRDMLSRSPVPYDSRSGDMLSRSPDAYNTDGTHAGVNPAFTPDPDYQNVPESTAL